jgi:hypothetical protein
MGTLYLVDANSATLSTSRIKDTFLIQNGLTPTLRGSFGVDLPFEVPMDGVPTTLSDLITKKYAGILAAYSGYSNILFDEQIDGTGWDTAASSGCAFTVGSRKTTSLRSSDGTPLVSNMSTLLTTPASCVVRFDLYSYFITDVRNAQMVRAFQEQTAASLGMTVEVSFNNGSVWNVVSNGVPLDIPLPSQGSSFRIRFSKNVVGVAGIGSWALIY